MKSPYQATTMQHSTVSVDVNIDERDHSGSCHSGLGPFWMLFIRDCGHLRSHPFGIVSIRNCAHLGGYPFGIVSIRDSVHSGCCPFGIASMRYFVYLGLCLSGSCYRPIVRIPLQVSKSGLNNTIAQCINVCDVFLQVRRINKY